MEAKILTNLEQINSVNQLFIARAIKSWDREGTGLFEDYIRREVSKSWEEVIGGCNIQQEGYGNGKKEGLQLLP